MSAYGKRQPRYTPVRGRRAEFATVELRRREYLGEARTAPREVPAKRYAGIAARAGATALLFASAVALVFSMGLAASPVTQDVAAGRRTSAQPHRVARTAQFDVSQRSRLAVAIPRRASAAIQSFAFATREQYGDTSFRAAMPPRAARASHDVVILHPRVLARAERPQEPGAVMVRAHERAASSSAGSTAAASANTSAGFAIEAQPWRLSADGTWTTNVVTVFTGAAGEREPHMRAVVDFVSSAGEIVDLDPYIYQSPALLLTTSGGAGVTITATAVSPASGSATLTLSPPPSDVGSFASVARVIGPRLIAVGWTPLAPTVGVQQYKVYRSVDGGAQELAAVVSPSGHAWRDPHVTPGASYRYTVVAQLRDTNVYADTQVARALDGMTVSRVDAISGKGMFLFFSPDTSDSNSYEQFDPEAVIAQAQRAGVSEIELRMSRGTFVEAASPAAHAWLDAFIDAAAGAGIKLLAWTVPRRNTADDAAQSIAMATYHTPAGNGFAGLALDLEPGTNYMGSRDVARERIADYMEMARQAVGPDYLLIATVISPRITHWTNEDYPYSRIARYASAMQPMEYWHHYRGGHEYARTDVSGQCADAVTLTRSLAGRDVPVNVAGQSADLGRTGAPSPDELHWCLGAARSAGAIGEMFFNWQSTTPDQWAAIEAYRW